MVFYFPPFLWNILEANSEDPDKTPHFAVSDLGLHCLPILGYRVCAGSS